jgi:hypothetical protein
MLRKKIRASKSKSDVFGAYYYGHLRGLTLKMKVLVGTYGCSLSLAIPNLPPSFIICHQIHGTNVTFVVGPSVNPKNIRFDFVGPGFRV